MNVTKDGNLCPSQEYNSVTATMSIVLLVLNLIPVNPVKLTIFSAKFAMKVGILFLFQMMIMGSVIKLVSIGFLKVNVFRIVV